MTPRIASPYTIQQTRSRPIVRTADRWAWWLLLLALGSTVFEGAIRKWLIPDSDPGLKYFIYCSKDIIFAAMMFLPRARAPKTKALLEFRRWLIPGVLILGIGACLSAFRDVNAVGALLSLRAAVFLPLMAFYVASRVGSVPLRRLACVICALTAFNFALSVVQNSLPANDMLNRYATGSLDIAVLKSGVRATGTFSYIAGLGIFSTVGIWAGMVLISFGGSTWYRIAGWLTIAFGFGCGLTSVSRGPIVIGAVMLLVWLPTYFGKVPGLLRNLLAAALFLGLVVTFELPSMLEGLGEGLLQRHETSNDTLQGRALGQLEESVVAVGMAPLGNGLGTEQVAGNYFRSGAMRFTTFESQLPRIVMETGLLGLIGFLIICAGAIWSLQIAKRYAPSQGERTALLATQLLLLPIFYTNVIFNHTASALMWMIFAAVMAAGKKALYDHRRSPSTSRAPLQAPVVDQGTREALTTLHLPG